MNKKEWLDKLYYDVGKQNFDFFLCGTYMKNGEMLFTKWKRYSECIFPIDFDGTCKDWKTQSFFNQINQRQVFPNEIVLDLENPKQLEELKSNLIDLDIPFSIWTAGKGYHFHIFFDDVKNITEEHKLFYLKKFNVDVMKSSQKTLIALEGTPHWKTGKIKEKIWEQI